MVAKIKNAPLVTGRNIPESNFKVVSFLDDKNFHNMDTTKNKIESPHVEKCLPLIEPHC